MSDLHKALADIGNIRVQLAAGTMFRGFGPTVVALSGFIALAAAAVQAAWPASSTDLLTFFAVWSAVAIVSSVLIGIEMLARTRRQHSGLADALLFSAFEHFLPVAIAGGTLGAIVIRFAPDTAWMLPGLWQMLVGLGLFAAIRFLPRTILLAAAWYFLAGTAVLMLLAGTRTLSPWAMGLPFGIGQLLLAAILRVAEGGENVEAE